MSDSSLSDTDRTDRLSVDLVGTGLLPPLPSAFLSGEARDLLAPLALARGTDLELPAAADVDRRALATALETANSSYGHPRARALSAKLADSATRVVVTGQQPGLFGGPLYTLTKAVAATLWAEHLEASGVPAVAAFWVSTEDHDFREVAQGSFPAPAGLLQVDLGEDRSPLLPMGMRTLGPEVESALEEVRRAMPGERYERWVDQLGAWYRPEARFGEAFCRLLAALLGERCPLLVDAMLPAVKAAQQPWMERLVTRRQEVEQAFEARDREIVDRGFELQVSPQRGASPLFVVHGRERRRVEWCGDHRFALRGREPFEERVEWLLELVAENPVAVSAGVLGRSALQDAILGTSVLLLGPGEVSYIPQVAPLYEVLEIPAPTVAMRPQAMVLAGHQVEKLEALELPLREILSAGFDADGFLARGRVNDMVAPISERIFEELDGLEAAALEIDRDLAKAWEKTRRQIDKALGAFSGRLQSALARRDEIARARLGDLLSTSRPRGVMQERLISTAHFPGKFGEQFVGSLFSQLTLDPKTLHVIIPGGDQ